MHMPAPTREDWLVSWEKSVLIAACS